LNQIAHNKKSTPMKHLLFIASLFLLTTLAQSCKKSNGDGEDKRLQSNIQNPIAVALPVANAFTDFSFSFFKTLQEEQPTTIQNLPLGYDSLVANLQLFYTFDLTKNVIFIFLHRLTFFLESWMKKFFF